MVFSAIYKGLLTPQLNFLAGGPSCSEGCWPLFKTCQVLPTYQNHGHSQVYESTKHYPSRYHWLGLKFWWVQAPPNWKSRVFPKIGGKPPKWMVYNYHGKPYEQMGDLGGFFPPFKETSMSNDTWFYPTSMSFSLYKPSILGYHHLRKHPLQLFHFFLGAKEICET